MHASNKPDALHSPGWRVAAGAHAAAVRGLWVGALGRTVRCVPSRRTVLARSDGDWLFGKWRHGHRRTAAAEWRWLHVLPLLGLHTPRPVAWLGRGRRTLLVTAGVPGRGLDAWAAIAGAEGWLADLVRYAIAEVAPAVRRLHGHGLVYRDLYWNHVFAADPRGGGAPWFIDVERVFQPRWRWRRWVVKDLAGLWASVPLAVTPRQGLRFLRAYLGAALGGERRLIRAIARKVARIRGHAPRYG
jgi:Lipopolysaccharide kinase (Kdo/WaaP) family